MKSSASPPGRGCKYTGQSVRALPIRIVTVGKSRSRGIQVIVDEYIEKLKFYCRIDDVQIKSNPKNARVLRAYCFALVDLMVMERNCVNGLIHQSSFHPWS